MSNINIKQALTTLGLCLIFCLIFIMTYSNNNELQPNLQKSGLPQIAESGQASVTKGQQMIEIHNPMVNISQPIVKNGQPIDDSGYKQRLPQCLIVGVQKAGTFALKSFLSIHPDIVVAGKEQHFFETSKYKKGLEYYRSHMPKSNSSQITIEKTPGYFFSPNAARNIKRMNSSIKILIIVREPVTRAISDYVQCDLLQGRTKPFEYYATKGNGSINTGFSRIRSSIYVKFTKFWLSTFKRKQIHFVNGDTLIKAPVAELTKVETFLGLRHYISEDNFVFNSTKGFFCWMQWDGKETCLGKSKGRPHPVVDEEVKRKLSLYYEKYNKQFFELIGEDFGWPS